MRGQFESIGTLQVLAVVVLTSAEQDFVKDVAGPGLKQRAVWTVAQQQGPTNARAVMSPDGCTADRLNAGERLYPLVAAHSLNHFLEQARAPRFPQASASLPGCPGARD